MEDVFGIFRFTFETYLQILDLSLPSDPVVSVAAGSPGSPVADSNACGAGRVSWPPRRVTLPTPPSDSERNISWGLNN